MAKQKMKTIKMTEKKYHELIDKINKLDSIVEHTSEMNDMYLSDLSELSRIKFFLSTLLKLEWNRDVYRYEEPKGEKVWPTDLKR